VLVWQDHGAARIRTDVDFLVLERQVGQDGFTLFDEQSHVFDIVRCGP
jgi:hypothetical protein